MMGTDIINFPFFDSTLLTCVINSLESVLMLGEI